jgi:BAAT / Acyl-CoA thioester hydrolase C terminal
MKSALCGKSGGSRTSLSDPVLASCLLSGRGHHGPGRDHRDAVIAAELIPGPVLLPAAGAGQAWPSAGTARALPARLHHHGHPHGHTLLEHPQAGHSPGYLIPQLPAGLLPPGITDHTADQKVRADAWPKTIQFLRQLPRPQ